MPVSVHQPPSPGVRSPTVVAHPEGEDIDVNEIGCLIVTRGEGREERVVAAYAPGFWVRAEVSETNN